MAITITLIISFILRVLFLSPWLEDWDSVQFALAMRDFDIGKDQPHAPGYILYVLLAKTLLFFTRNETLALTLLSAISGTVLVLFVYLLAKKLFDKKTAYFASILTLICPIVWMMSIVALTNIVGLLALTIFAYILLRNEAPAVNTAGIFSPRFVGAKSLRSGSPLLFCEKLFAFIRRLTSEVFAKGGKNLISLSFLGGLILGIRLTELPVVVTLLSLKHLPWVNFKKMLFSLVAFVAGIAFWLIPTIIASGDLQKVISSYGWITKYVLTHDAMMGNRFQRIYYLFDVSYTLPFLVVSGISLLSMVLARPKGALFILSWLASYLVPLFFIYNLEVPRYTLPLAVPLTIITAWFFANKINFKISVITTILVGSAMFHQGLSQVRRFKNSTPPNIVAVKFVKDNLSSQEALVLASFTYRQFQYYAPEFNSIYEVIPSTDTINNYKFVVIDYLGLMDNLPKDYEKETVATREFTGDIDIYSRVPKVNIFVLRLTPKKTNEQ